MTRKVQVAVLGAGTAGLNARRGVESLGGQALLIDRGPLGTTCARVGCMPSKLLIAAANAAYGIRHAPTFGVHSENLSIDGKAVMHRVRSERDRFVGFVTEATDDLRDEGKLIDGAAQFTSPNTLEVEGHGVIEFERAVIATGSSPWTPAAYRDLGDALAINDDVFYWDDLPKSVFVVGTGVIGLELGQALHRLGVRVVVVGRRGSVGGLTDPEVREAAAKAFAEDFPIYPEFELESATKTPGGVGIKGCSSCDTPIDEVFECVLTAAGRRPNLSQLNLDAAGIALDDGGLPVGFDPRTLQIGESPFFLAGDVANVRPLLHEAADEGRIAGRNAIRYPETQAETRRTPLAVVFSEPQIASVGCRYDQIDLDKVAIGAVSYHNQGRARVMAENRGMLRVYADRQTGQMLGAEMCGPAMEHIGHLLAWSVQQRMTCDEMLAMPFYHPVVEEGLRTALQSLKRELHAFDAGACGIRTGA